MSCESRCARAVDAVYPVFQFELKTKQVAVYGREKRAGAYVSRKRVRKAGVVFPKGTMKCAKGRIETN